MRKQLEDSNPFLIIKLKICNQILKKILKHKFLLPPIFIFSMEIPIALNSFYLQMSAMKEQQSQLDLELDKAKMQEIQLSNELQEKREMENQIHHQFLKVQSNQCNLQLELFEKLEKVKKVEEKSLNSKQRNRIAMEQKQHLEINLKHQK